MFKIFTTLIILFGQSASDTPRVVTGPTSIITAHDTFPDFGLLGNIVTAGPGDWFDNNTWSGGVIPKDDDVVLITENITYSGKSDTNIDSIIIEAGGSLTFLNTPNKLRVGTIFVHDGATLTIGEKNSPITESTDIIFTNRPFKSIDPKQYGNGLVAMGDVFINGEFRSPYIRLAQESKKGDTQLYLEYAPINWKVGDLLYIPTTEQVPDGEASREMEEYKKIVAINDKVITIDTSLAHSHAGAKIDGVLAKVSGTPLLPHIVNINRNVVLRSENPSGIRGHILVTDRTTTEINNVGLYDLGRTLNTPLGPTNQQGRYAMHFHYVNGKVNNPNPYQFEFVSNSIYTSNPISRWGLTVHGSHYGLIQNNTVVNIAGAGIVTEDGSESYNLFEKNFVGGVKGIGGRADTRGNVDLAWEGSGYWFRGSNNYVRGNIANNAVNGNMSGDGFVYYQQFGRKDLKIPASKGAVPSIPYNVYAYPVLEFTDNEVYGKVGKALSPWWVGTEWKNPQTDKISYIKNLTAWHVNSGGSFYETANWQIDDLVVVGNPNILKTLGGATGINFQDYMQNKLVINNPKIHNMQIGINLPTNTAPPDSFGLNAGLIRVNYPTLQNKRNIVVNPLWDNNNAQRYAPGIYYVNSPKFLKPTIWESHINYATGGGTTNFIQWTKVVVENDNGESYEIFSPLQAPEAILPQTLPNKQLGSPEAGLTNQVNWNRFGIARNGEVSPSILTRPGILGFTKQLGSFPIIQSIPNFNYKNVPISFKISALDPNAVNFKKFLLTKTVPGVKISESGDLTIDKGVPEGTTQIEVKLGDVVKSFTVNNNVPNSTFDLVNGVLTVRGKADNDVIGIFPNPNGVTILMLNMIDGKQNVTLNPFSNVTRVIMFGNDGNDTLVADQSPVPVTLYGGAGADVLVDSKQDDEIHTDNLDIQVKIGGTDNIIQE